MEPMEHELGRNAYPRSASQSVEAGGIRPQHRGSAFSLIEVVIATAIFAGAVTVLFALLTATLRDATGAADTQTALRLPDAIEVTLREIAAREGLAGLAARIPTDEASGDRGFLLVATRDGESVRRPGSTSGGAATLDAYYLIDLRRFPTGALAFDAARTVLPLHVRVSWPYQVPASDGPAAPVAFDKRQSVAFNLTVGN